MQMVVLYETLNRVHGKKQPLGFKIEISRLSNGSTVRNMMFCDGMNERSTAGVQNVHDLDAGGVSMTWPTGPSF